MTAPRDFILTNTTLIAPPLVPEIKLYLASEVVPLWRKTEEELEAEGVPPPYWAFAWAGGQALSRYVLDHPETVSKKSVLDFGSGSGVVAIAAAKAGGKKVLAADIDKFALAAIAENARMNDAAISITADDVTKQKSDWQTVLIGDMCYERPLAERLLSWSRDLASGRS